MHFCFHVTIGNQIPYQSQEVHSTYIHESFKCTYATRLPRKPSRPWYPTWYKNAKDLDGRKQGKRYIRLLWRGLFGLCKNMVGHQNDAKQTRFFSDVVIGSVDVLLRLYLEGAVPLSQDWSQWGNKEQHRGLWRPLTMLALGIHQFRYYLVLN